MPDRSRSITGTMASTDHVSFPDLDSAHISSRTAGAIGFLMNSMSVVMCDCMQHQSWHLKVSGTCMMAAYMTFLLVSDFD